MNFIFAPVLNEFQERQVKRIIHGICSPTVLLLISVVIIGFSIWAPMLFMGTWPTFFPFTEFGPIVFSAKTGWIGDTFGIMNPIIAIAAAIITFAAFYMQWLANEKVNTQENHRQINELTTYHLTLVESIKLYETNNEYTIVYKDKVVAEKHDHVGSILRAGSESLYTLYSKMYFYWVMQDIFGKIKGNDGTVRIKLFGQDVTIAEDAINKVINDWAEKRRNAIGLEKDVCQYISKEEKIAFSRAALERLIDYYGYLFMHVFSHLFYVFEEIESNPVLSEKEKARKGIGFAKMIPAFEVVLVFLMIEFDVECFVKENRVKEVFPILKKYGFFRILMHVDFFMKNEFLTNKAKYV